jgi:hypothetical protein
MPAQEFLDKFFLVNELSNLSNLAQFVPGHYETTLKAKSEPLAYGPFVSQPSSKSSMFFTTIDLLDTINRKIHH